MDYSWSPRHSRFFATPFAGIIPVLGSIAVQFGDHLWYWDHLRGRTGIAEIMGSNPV